MNKLSFKKELNGKRVKLKVYSSDFTFASLLYNLIIKNYEHRWPWQRERVDNIEVLQEGLKNLENKFYKSQSAYYGVYLKDTLIGSCGIEYIDWSSKRCEAFYWLDKDYCNQGYATEAMKIVEKEFFSLGFNKITLRIFSENTPSVNIAKKLEYVLEGTLREDMFLENKFYDRDIYSKLEKEWKEKNE